MKINPVDLRQVSVFRDATDDDLKLFAEKGTLRSIEEGEFFRSGGVKTSFAHNIDQANGRVFVGVNRTGTDGAKGEGGLVTV